MGTPDRPPEPHCARSNQIKESDRTPAAPLNFPCYRNRPTAGNSGEEDPWSGRPLPQIAACPVIRRPSTLIRDGRPAVSTPTARGQFVNFSPESTNSEDGEDSFRFFRLREARLYDEETFHNPEQGEIDAACGDPPNRWTDVNLSLLMYIDDFNGVKKLYKKSAILTLSQKKPWPQ